MTDTAQNSGLSSEEAASRLITYGPNRLISARKISPLKIFFRQFTSGLVLILIVAGLIAAVLGEYTDTIAIGVIVLLNGILGFAQEYRAERSLNALSSMLSERAFVERDGQEQYVDAETLVPGDLVILEEGGRVPADLQIIRAIELRLDESTLTGESVPVTKRVADPGDPDTIAYMGTATVSGRARGIVVSTGMNTEFGHIAMLTGSVGQKQTHLQRTLGTLGKQLGLAAILVALVIIALGIWTGRDPVEMFLTGVSLAVAMVPEGLPTVVTVTLAIGAAEMMRCNVLSRRLQATETLGAASVICTDKTGTLTENQMTASSLWLPSGWVQVTGTGYDPSGHFEVDGERISYNDNKDLCEMLNTGLICNNAHIDHVGQDWKMTGDPTEGALVTLAYKAWLEPLNGNQVMQEIPFSSDRKRMSVTTDGTDGLMLHSKGAPEVLLDRCSHWMRDGEMHPLATAERSQVENALAEMGAKGLRVLAIARRSLRGLPKGEDPEDDMVLLGLVGIIDPPRFEVAQAVSEAQSAGIQIVMITGDSPTTAMAIGQQLGIEAKRAVTGAELNEMSDGEVLAVLDKGAVFARTAPHQKMRLVELLQSHSGIVAMTGDGVNDAPALKKADIGIAMGKRGTDVAKDAADMVLLDDNFASIVNAIREGRRQFANIRKFVRYLLASNAGEVVAIFANLLIGGPLIFLTTQILWMNLVTDGVTALALGMEHAERDTMRQPPRKGTRGILGRDGLAVILCFGIYTASASLLIFYTFLDQGVVVAQTAAFTAMVFFEKSSVFAFRSLTLPTYRIGFFSNPLLLGAVAITLLLQIAAVYMPVLQTLLHTTGLNGQHWQMILLLCLPLIIVPEIIKLAFIK